MYELGTRSPNSSTKPAVISERFAIIHDFQHTVDTALQPILNQISVDGIALGSISKSCTQRLMTYSIYNQEDGREENQEADPCRLVISIVSAMNQVMKDYEILLSSSSLNRRIPLTGPPWILSIFFRFASPTCSTSVI